MYIHFVLLFAGHMTNNVTSRGYSGEGIDKGSQGGMQNLRTWTYNCDRSLEKSYFYLSYNMRNDKSARNFVYFVYFILS